MPLLCAKFVKKANALVKQTHYTTQTIFCQEQQLQYITELNHTISEIETAYTECKKKNDLLLRHFLSMITNASNHGFVKYRKKFTESLNQAKKELKIAKNLLTRANK